MIMDQMHEKKEAELILWERKILNLRGIEDVVSFDDVSVYLITKEGNLLVEGTELHITALDVSSGNMTIEGYVRSMVYTDKENAGKNGFLTRIFK